VMMCTKVHESELWLRRTSLIRALTSMRSARDSFDLLGCSESQISSLVDKTIAETRAVTAILEELKAHTHEHEKLFFKIHGAERKD